MLAHTHTHTHTHTSQLFLVFKTNVGHSDLFVLHSHTVTCNCRQDLPCLIFPFQISESFTPSNSSCHLGMGVKMLEQQWSTQPLEHRPSRNFPRLLMLKRTCSKGLDQPRYCLTYLSLMPFCYSLECVF